MLKLTKTVEYALISMNYIENNGKDKPVPAKLISNQFSIPEELLAKILQKLVKINVLGQNYFVKTSADPKYFQNYQGKLQSPPN